MTSKYPNLFKPISIGNIELKNRIVHVPTDISSANVDGSVNGKVIHHYSEVAKSGVGFIIIGATTPDDKTGRPGVTSLVVDSDKYIPGLHELAKTLQRYGSKCAVQIQHPGRQAALPRYGQISCSDIITDQPGSAGHEIIYAGGEKKGKIARSMTVEEVYEQIDCFSEAAWRVQQAGFDAVELHAAHGYLIAQFMSSYSNNRNDRFGGSFRNRMRFPLDIIAGIKVKCGKDFPILVRYSAVEWVPEGITLEESLEIAKVLENNGVAALDVSTGMFDSPGPTMDPVYYPQGWNTYTAEATKKVVSIPVITSHSLRDPDFCEKILAKGKTDLVGFSRQFIADPYWTIKVSNGKEEDIRKCISCLVGCWQDSLMIKRFCKCSINPAFGDERFWDMEKTSNPINIAIVGGGPAGMEAARISSLRGHKPTLFEKNDELGGALRYSSRIPGKKEKMGWYLDWTRRQIKKLGIETILKTEPKVEELMSYDIVLVGVGGRSPRPEIPGIEKALGFEEVLSGRTPQIGDKVIVWGGGGIGADVAETFSFAGKDVCIINQERDFMANVEPVHRQVLMMRLAGDNAQGLKDKTAKIPVKIFNSTTVNEINSDEVLIENSDFEKKILPADTVVVAWAEPVEGVFEKILKAGCKAANMGDSLKVRNLGAAVADGANYGLIAEKDALINAAGVLYKSKPFEVGM